MPGTVQDLSRKLLNAIDSQGNVTDMVIVLEVVEALEGITITADDIRTNCLGRNINQLRRKLSDSDKSLAKRLKKLVKAWQQLIQSQTPNGLSAPSLGAAASSATANSNVEQSSSDGHQRLNVVGTGSQRRKSVSSSRSCEGALSQSSVVGESLADKSSHLTTTATGSRSHRNASRTPTPTPSPHPPATPSSFSASTSPSSIPPQSPSVSLLPPASVSTPNPTPQPAVIPRPTKAQDFARNRIRRMQMLAQVAPQSLKSTSQPPSSTTNTLSTNSATTDKQRKEEDTGKPHLPQFGDENLQSQQQMLALGSQPTGIQTAALKSRGYVSQSERGSAANTVVNGSHFKASSSSNSPSPYSNSTPQSSPNAKFINTYSRGTTPSLSQIVTNSFNHSPSTFSVESPLPASSSNATSQSFTIARKVGVKGSLERTSQERLSESPSLETLLVRIPRNLVQINPGSHQYCEARGLGRNFGSESVLSSRQAAPSDVEEFSLMVSIDLSLLRGVSTDSLQTTGHGLDINPVRTEWSAENHHIPAVAVKKERSFSGNNDSEPMETEMAMSFGKRGIPHPCMPLAPAPQLVPSGASLGVDGCVGPDGYWYSWTDTIPGEDGAMTVLPYIYVDDESDMTEIFTN